MIRLFGWVIAKIGRHTIGLLALLFIVLISMVAGIAAVVRELETGFLWPLAFWAMILSWFLAHSRVSGRQAVFMGFVVGLGFVLLRVGRLERPLLDLLVGVFRVGKAWISPNVSPNFLPLQFQLSKISTIVSEVNYRLYTWFVNFTRGTPLFDKAALEMIWGGVSWGTSFWAGWSLRRHAQPVWAIMPSTVVLVVGLTYTSGRGLLLVPVLGATLALMGIVKHDVREQGWEKNNLDYAAVIREEMTWVILGISLAGMVLATLVPSISVLAVFHPVREYLRDRIDENEDVVRSFGLDPRAGAGEEELGSVGGLGDLPRSQLIGSGPELSEQVVMVVHILSGWTGREGNQYLPIYFRSRSFDEYTGHGWSTSDTTSHSYQAGVDIRARSQDNHRTILQEIRMTRDGGGILNVAGSLITADHDFSVFRRISEQNETSVKQNWDVFGAVVESSTYQALSLLPVVSEETLMSIPDEYPSWVKARYLYLPDTPSQRVLDLANELTKTQPTTYDKVRSIESYLRTYPYTLDLPAPPEEKDVVDYFLFELKEGYCDYYATAMVVLARSAGIPARIVSGYTRGFYEQENDRFIITQADAHSWVEVYFHGIGWVPFEPTGGRPALDRPVQALDVPPELEAPIPSDVLKPEPALLQWNPRNLFVGISLLLIGGFGAWIVFDVWSLRNASPNETIKKVYTRLYGYGERLAVARQRAVTPNEFCSFLTAEIDSISEGKYFQRILSPSIPQIHDMTEIYIRAAYSPRSLSVADQTRALELWRGLRYRLVIGIVLRRFRSLFSGEVYETGARLH